MVSPWVVSLNPPIISLPLIVTKETTICPGISSLAPFGLQDPYKSAGDWPSKALSVDLMAPHYLYDGLSGTSR